MLKTLFLTLLALTIAVGGGAASVWMMLEEARPVGAVSAGPWTAFPSVGTREADPYSRARFARQGGIPLGRSEGITFTAGRDSNGRSLRRECAYRIEGPMPTSRFWTLYAAGPEGALLPPFKRRRAALHSQMVLRHSDNGFSIVVSRHPVPSNWLAVTGDGPMRLVLTLFDTPVASGARVEELSLPRITRTTCDG
ncbi:DUF1214 domain-containing protein [Chelativorans xinjiangense]|uniref:DUF1214 domain-containing protein n=1 Tax=Chelativorans xinjiangense TaxID=2681485 RepID=UPI001359FCC2|nr:DUF1214 domain-containing protein [Chelativorans xinjiangense]